MSPSQVPAPLCPQPSWAPTLLRAKAQGFLVAQKALQDLPHPLLALPLSAPSLTLLQSHRPPHCSSNTAGMMLPQDLCMCYAHCLEGSASIFEGVTII